MAVFKMEIRMDNAAFDEPELELSRLLRSFSDLFGEHCYAAEGFDRAVMDINGNKVGRAWVDDEEEGNG